MQKKNILIASLCATIMLLVPFTSISGASIGGLNTKDAVIEESNPDIDVIDSKFIEEIEVQDYFGITPDDFTLEDLRDLVIKIDLLFGHYPEVAESCENIIEILDVRNPILCKFFTNLLSEVFELRLKILEILIEEGSEQIYVIFFILSFVVIQLIFNLVVFYCEEVPQQVVNDLSLTQLINIENSNQCPCIQE